MGFAFRYWRLGVWDSGDIPDIALRTDLGQVKVGQYIHKVMAQTTRREQLVELREPPGYDSGFSSGGTTPFQARVKVGGSDCLRCIAGKPNFSGENTSD